MGLINIGLPQSYKIFKANNSHNFFFNFVLNEWRELDSLISFSNEL